MSKALIIALVVIAVLFLVTIVMGASHGSPPADPDHAGAVGALKGLQGNRFLTLGDKASASCASPGQTSFTVSGSCTIVLDKRGLLSTSTRVTLVLSAPALIEVIPRSGAGQNKFTGGCVGIAFDHSGGSLTISGNTNVDILHRGCT